VRGRLDAVDLPASTARGNPLVRGPAARHRVVTVMLARMGRNGPMLALLAGPLLFAVSAGGNIQALMVLSLLWGFNRGSGPLWVAIAASMKYTPILLALTYVARREWLKAISAGLLAAALIGPGFVLGLLNAGVRSQAAASL